MSDDLPIPGGVARDSRRHDRRQRLRNGTFASNANDLFTIDCPFLCLSGNITQASGPTGL
jgi:hypothetical protein